MTPFPRALPVFLSVVLLTLLIPGCVKFKHALTIKPDGSGKVEITIGMSDTVLAHQGDDGKELIDLDELVDQENRGFVAFTAPESWAEGGFTFYRVVGYFEDIERVVIEGDDDPEADGPVVTTFDFDADAGTLAVSRCLLQQVAMEVKAIGADDPSQQALVGAMLSGMEIEESITVPGDIGDAGPFESTGDTASGKIDEEALLGENGDAMTIWRDSGEVIVSYEPADWEDADRDAWLTEVAEAKAAWEAIKASGMLVP
ncbi:MAG: hypothetical protein AAGH92_09080 [Planctomycetota bacterium]